jgi:hypothetical protein
MSRPAKGLALAAGLLAALAPAHQGTASAQPRPAEALCQGSEVVLFTCGVGTKVVSICGQGQGRTVYRFGRPDRVELEATDLYFAEQAFSGGGETQVYANTPTHRYIVYDRVVRTSFDDGRHDPQAESGLVVQSGGQTVLSRRCASSATFDRLTRTMVPAGDYTPH